MRLGVIVACVVLASVARADQAAPLEPISAARGVVAQVVDVQLGATAHVTLIEWRELATDDAPAQLPHWTELAPFRAGACARVFAFVDRATGWTVGETTRGLLIPAERPNARSVVTVPWCRVRDGIADATELPALTSLAKAEGDAILPGLARLAAFFGADEPPIASELGQALRELESDAALQLAIDLGQTSLAADHFRWRTDPAHFDVVERAAWSQRWARGHPDLWLATLYWHLSPGRAAARTRAEYATDPTRALAMATMAPPWDEALALQLELTAAQRAAGRPAVTTLWFRADERAADFLRAELATATEPYLRAGIEEQLAKFDARVQRGVTDAVTLATYLRAHPDDDDVFRDMRLRVTGPSYLGCDVHLKAPRYELRVKADCDAETQQRMYKVADGTPITVTGSLRRTYEGSDYFEIELDAAHVELAPAAAAIDAGVAGAPPDAFSAQVERPDPERARREGGGCCDTGGDGGLGALFVIAWLACATCTGARRR